MRLEYPQKAPDHTLIKTRHGHSFGNFSKDNCDRNRPSFSLIRPENPLGCCHSGVKNLSRKRELPDEAVYTSDAGMSNAFCKPG